jgi:hypothetical protein
LLDVKAAIKATDNPATKSRTLQLGGKNFILFQYYSCKLLLPFSRHIDL